jgi:uncharacterized PurR-regulated membrane protein YhhQ (DUF165 family)
LPGAPTQRRVIALGFVVPLLVLVLFWVHWFETQLFEALCALTEAEAGTSLT